MKFIGVFYCIVFFLTQVQATEYTKTNIAPEPKLRGDEILPLSRVVPYIGGRQSPGDSIGMTAYEYQACGCYGQRIDLDSRNQAHINWMWQDFPGQTMRYCAWDARYVNGTYFGETQASLSWSGFVQVDVTRDINPDSQRTVIAYHYDAGNGYRSWIDIDEANLAGTWPNDPKDLDVNDYLWPRITITENNNILLATGDRNFERNHLFRSTDMGDTWTLIADFDSVHKFNHFLRSSHFPGSQKVVFVWTKYFCDTTGCGCIDQNVWYMTSSDNGMTWSNRINLTDYQPYPNDSARAYVSVNALYDANDNLHITWAGRKVTDQVYQASKIFHWDEINDTITVVSSPSIYYNDPGGWWIDITGGGTPGAYHMPAIDPQLIVDTTTNLLYCLWQGNDDYNDYSAGGFINGELYGSYSTDNGLTWSDYINLTNTRSPGAGPGECMDEDYMTACPYMVNDSIYITYIEDKDAGGWVQGEGIVTENPVRCWVFHKSLITGVEEENVEHPNHVGATIFSGPLLLPEGKNCRVFDITGRVVTPQHIKPGIYFIEVDGKITQKVVKVR